jgi:hypothetical protein
MNTPQSSAFRRFARLVFVIPTLLSALAVTSTFAQEASPALTQPSDAAALASGLLQFTVQDPGSVAGQSLQFQLQEALSAHTLAETMAAALLSKEDETATRIASHLGN